MIAREAYACLLLGGRLPVPQTIATGEDFLIETWLPGKMLSEASLSEAEKAQAYRAWGRAVRTMHETATEGYGEMQPHRKGQYAHLHRHVGAIARRHLLPLRGHRAFFRP